MQLINDNSSSDDSIGSDDSSEIDNSLQSDDSDLENSDLDNDEIDSNVVDFKTRSIFKPTPGGVPVEHPRWANLTIPLQFEVTKNGMARKASGMDPYTGKEGKTNHISGPIVVLALTDNLVLNNAGLVIEFETKMNRFQTLTIPLARLHHEPRLLAQDLASFGFHIEPGKEKDLLVYLAVSRPAHTKMAVTQTGWAPSLDPAKLIFVYRTGATDPDYFLQSDRIGSVEKQTLDGGTLDDWNRNIFDDSPYPLFALCCSLAAPLLKFAPSMPSVGVHFYGDSTSGKTAMLQYAASAWGCGCEPDSQEKHPYICRWNSTQNGFEGQASAHNHMPFIVDEMGSSGVKDLAQLIYNFSGGVGKEAMDSTRTMKTPKRWQTFLISSGEVSSLEKMEEPKFGTKKSQVKAGAAFRLQDILISKGAIRNKEQADRIKVNAGKYFGSLGPAFVQAIVENFTLEGITDIVEHNLTKAVTRLSEGRGLGPLQLRALKTIALAEVAGLLLVHFKLIPGLNLTKVQAAIDVIVRDWSPGASELNDSTRAVQALREYVLKYRDSRFKEYPPSLIDLAKPENKEKEKLSISGYCGDIEGDSVYLFPDAMKEATGGEIRTATALLLDKGWLKSSEKNKRTYRLTLDGQQVRGYCISSEFLGED